MTESPRADNSRAENRRASHTRAETARDGRNAARGHKPAEEAVDAGVNALSEAALAPLSLYRSIAQESLHFWARRLHAYASWAEAVSCCRTPQDMMQAQTAFMAQVQQDYTEESAAMASLMRAGIGGEADARS